MVGGRGVSAGQTSGARHRLGRLILAQAGACAAAVAIAWVLGGRSAALAAALGGLSCLIPSAWFAARVFAAERSEPGAMLRALYWGEGVKLVGIALLLVGIFRLWPQVPAPALIMGLIAVQAAHWFAPLLLLNE